VKGDERFDIDVLVGGCKGNCVIEATSTHTKRLDPASYDKPVVEKKSLFPLTKPMCATMKTVRSGLPMKNAERNNHYSQQAV